MKNFEKNLKALANKRRLEIIKYLKRNMSANVGQIAKEIRLSYKSTSKHLGILFAQDIVSKEQVRFEVVYELSPRKDPEVENIIKLL
ncbi:MAG: hypothetical protein US50_C0013G0008 [Candidatus Nomurabacteria bacterium GW2011_GWB1_37_5]|uniref:HTH arsR-type domain-containing protein n=1 Tax=Candidatus Nomurabacteria bacterium GW2011_GWB1_37_5 TaxID=1618742 RepID=A0A0G0JFF6_9BACT|nr:MAG: hypothetical protein US50_C0013G0008 [Candidatus Nomurabacteria bacterium GW2011_GWB1_37_5]